MTPQLQVRHIYDHEPGAFEAELNEALRRLAGDGAVVADIKYSSDPPTEANRRGGFSALILFELPASLN